MKQQHICKFAWTAALLLLLLVCSACGQQTDDRSNTPGSTEQAACYVLDTNGQPINGWYSEGEGLWYLFVPGSEDLATLTLYVNGEVTETSSGVLDPETDTISDPFAGTEELTLTRDGIQMRVIAKQSDLPSLHIALEDATLDEIHADKTVKFPGNSVYLSDPQKKYDFTAEHCVEMKGRGNSSWANYEKKGYQLKFSEPVTLMGMPPAQKWVLLANSSDDSMMRTQLVYQMAKQFDMAFVPSFTYIDLWINGDYRGTYLLGEKVEIGSNRLNLTDPLGGLYEHDEIFYPENPNWFVSEPLGRHFVQKEAVVDSDAGIVHAAIVDFQTATDKLTEYLYSTPSTQIMLDDLSRMIDVDSFAKYYLINEFTLNRESYATSFYWYKDGAKDVLHLGPIWDFDTCMGNDGAGYTENYGDEHVLFKYLLAIPAFRQRVIQLQETYWPQLTGMDEQIDALCEEITTSAELNYLRWNVLGQPNPKGGSDFSPTFAEAVSTLKSWLGNRERYFSIPEPRTPSAKVNSRCTTMDLYYEDDQEYASVRFAVWSLITGQENLQWCSGQKDKSGGWSCTVDLSVHNSAGMYRIDVYPDDSPIAVASGRSYVEYASAPAAWIEASLREDGETLDLVLQHTKGRYNWIRFAVWSAEGEQDDLLWYDARNGQSKSWRAEVDLGDHSGTGTYHIHAFSEDGLLATETIYVPRGGGSTTLFAEPVGIGQSLKLTLEGAPKTLDEVCFAVWCDRGGQDDIAWYTAGRSGSIWVAEVALSYHGGAGKFMIHAYDGTTGDRTLLDDTEIYVQPLEQGEPELLIQPNQEGNAVIITLDHADQYDKVWFPVWSVEGNQADMIWYDGVWNSNGTWTCTAAVNSPASYVVQAYTGDAGPTDMLADATVYVDGQLPEIPNPQVETSLSEDGQYLTIRLFGAELAHKVWIPFWSEENAQDDVVWYQPEKGSDGVWSCTVNLNDHGAKGIYHIHVYHGVGEPIAELAAISVEIP